MRVTNNMMVMNAIRNINAAASRMNEASERVSSQQKIALPSDDPVIATRTIKYRDYVAKISQYKENADAAVSWQKTTDDSMSNLYDVVDEIRGLAAKAANSGTLTDSDLADIKTEIGELQQEIVEIMNADYGGRYIYGGFTTSEEPYALAEKSMLGTVTATAGSYDASNISITDELAAGNYSVTVTESGGVYSVTMTDGTDSYTGSTASGTGTVALTNAAGDTVATLTAPAAGYANGDAFSFAVSTETVVTFKGQNLSTVMSGDVSATAMSALYTGNTYTDGADESINYNVGYDNEVTVNIEGQDVIGSSDSNLFNTVAKLLLALDGDSTYKSCDAATGAVSTGTIADVSDLLGDLDTDLERITTAQATLGARMNYVSRVADRLDSDKTTYTELLSNTIDVDISEATIEQSSSETVYEASLSVGAKAISKTLVDYMA